MATIRDIQVIREERDATLEPVREFSIAILIYVDSPDLDAKASGRTDYVWASEFNQPESSFRILNRAVPPTVGLAVKIGYPEKPPFERQVLGIWEGIGDLSGYTSDEGGALNSQPHAQSHRYPSESSIGTDPVLIFQPAMQQLKTTGNGSTLVVTIAALPSYRFRDVFKAFNGGTLDVTSSVPAVASRKRSVLVYLDAETNAIKSVDGTLVIALDSIIAPKPALPANGIASAYIVLTNGQSAVTTATHITDAREFLEPRINDPLLSATAAGQILISNDGISFEAGIPVVDVNGDILTDLNGHIVVI